MSDYFRAVRPLGDSDPWTPLDRKDSSRDTVTTRRMNVTLIDGDLLEQDVDVIVNVWHRTIIPWWLLQPQGVSGAIKKRGGFNRSFR